MKWYYYYHSESDCIWKQNLKFDMSKSYDEVIELKVHEAVQLSDNTQIPITKINLKTSKMAKEDKKSKKDKGAEKGKSKEPEKAKKEDTGKKDKKAKKPAEHNGEFTQKKFSGSIALTKLVHVVMTKTNKKGKKVKGLFIPIAENHLVEGKEGAVYMALNVVTKSPQDDYGQNGFISQNGGKKWSEASEKEKEAYKQLPILGNIKDFEDSKGSSSNDTSGAKGEIDEDDDLPF